jgi:hypothetical protein
VKAERLQLARRALAVVAIGLFPILRHPESCDGQWQ